MSNTNGIELETITNQAELRQNLPHSTQAQQGIYDQINQVLNQQDQQKKTVQEARDVLGTSASSLTDEEVYDLVNEMQYLVDTWVEEYERKVFEGKTLDDILGFDSK